MQYELVADGHPDANGMALVMHNERLADPLDSITRALAAVTSIKKKTTANHEEIARIEWFGGLYTSERIEAVDGEIIVPAGAVPTIPAWNLLRSLQDGARRHKRGLDVPRGIHPLAVDATLEYDGPTDIHELWAKGSYTLRKTVGVQQRRTMRTRPIFHPWKATLAIEVDPVVFDMDTLAMIWADAGRYAGLGEMRPVYGRYNATVREPAKAVTK